MIKLLHWVNQRINKKKKKDETNEVEEIFILPEKENKLLMT